MMNEGKEDLVLAVRVAPYGIAEEIFMRDFGELKEKYKVKEVNCLLGVLYGTSYNMYVLDFDNETDFREAENGLSDYFYNMTVQNDFDGESYMPEVVWLRRERQ